MGKAEPSRDCGGEAAAHDRRRVTSSGSGTALNLTLGRTSGGAPRRSAAEFAPIGRPGRAWPSRFAATGVNPSASPNRAAHSTSARPPRPCPPRERTDDRGGEGEASRVRTDLARGEWREATRVTFAECAVDWIDTYSGRTGRSVRPATLNDYRDALRRDTTPSFVGCSSRRSNRATHGGGSRSYKREACRATPSGDFAPRASAVRDGTRGRRHPREPVRRDPLAGGTRRG